MTNKKNIYNIITFLTIIAIDFFFFCRTRNVLEVTAPAIFVYRRDPVFSK